MSLGIPNQNESLSLMNEGKIQVNIPKNERYLQALSYLENDEEKIDYRFKICNKKHKLEFSYKKEGYDSGIFFCDICSKSQSCEAGRFACLECKYYCCWKCIKPESAMINNMCPQNHDLEFQCNSNGNAPQDYLCDLCGAKYPNNARRLYCRKCNFNLCWNCKKPKPSEILEKCIYNHPLIFSSTSSDGHSKEYRCDLCEETHLCEPGRYNCFLCAFDLCWNCMHPTSFDMNNKCSKNHELKFSYSFENGYDSGYFCDFCL